MWRRGCKQAPRTYILHSGPAGRFSLEVIYQGHPMRGQLLMQLPEEHCTLVPLLGLPQGVVESGLKVNNVSDLLFTVNFCKIVLGFIEVLNGGLQSWWKVGKYHTCLTKYFIYSFQNLISSFTDLTCTRYFYILLFETKKNPTRVRFLKKSLVLVSSLVPGSIGSK